MLLSVIVPTWNSVENLRSFLDSWVASGMETTRLVVVDDGSVDSTLSLLARSAGHPSLLFARQSNAGPGSARNLGLSAIDTPYVTFADVDDSIDWPALSRVTLQLQEAPTIDVVTCPLVTDSSITSGIALKAGSIHTRLQFLRSRMAVWGRIYRTSLLRDLQPLFPATRAGEDVVATVKVASASRIFGDSSTAFYHHHPNFSSLTHGSNYAEKALASLRILEELPVERALKAYALAASAKFFFSRGERRAGIQSARLAARACF